MSAKKLLALWGLKWNPFTPELPDDALLTTAKIENFAWRVEQLVQEGGFALISTRQAKLSIWAVTSKASLGSSGENGFHFSPHSDNSFLAFMMLLLFWDEDS